MRIGVLAAESGWHFQDLLRAANESRELRYEVEGLSFSQLSAGVNENGASFASGRCVSKADSKSGVTGETPSPSDTGHGVDLTTLDRLIVRAMPAGSLQQIVFRMDVLNRLEASGVKVFNSPRAVEISVDKYLSLAMLADADIPVPETFVAQTVREGIEYFDRLGGEVVYKPIFGSMGNGIRLLEDRSEALSFFQQQIGLGEVLYLQKFIPHGHCDVRVMVIGDQTVAMQRRRPGHWLTNIAQGATGHPIFPSPRQRDVAMSACDALGCRIAGVDLIQDARTGRELVVDVNSSPGWQALSAVSGVDIATLILKEVADG
jgi:RimK family alpha-L-glutamate ligase